MAGSADNPFRACAYCGTQFELDEDYPVLTEERDGEITFFSFCDDDCRTAWEAEHRDGTGRRS